MGMWIHKVREISKMEDLVLSSRHHQEQYSETWSLWNVFFFSEEGQLVGDLNVYINPLIKGPTGYGTPTVLTLSLSCVRQDHAGSIPIPIPPPLLFSHFLPSPPPSLIVLFQSFFFFFPLFSLFNRSLGSMSSRYSNI